MRMNRKLLMAIMTAIMTIVPVLLMVLAVTPAAAVDGGMVSGSVYYDSNGNSQPELGEANVPNATVYVQRVDAAAPIVIAADANGNFVLTDLPYGAYQVWAEDAQHNLSPAQSVKLDEVTGANSLELPIVHDPSNEIEGASVANLYLPLVTAD
jgi:hypothetical protein